MTGLASPSQSRMSFLRWAIVAVPLIVLLGSLSGGIGGSAGESSWYAALQKPALVPPGWVFGVAWTILYALMGLALAMILNARGERKSVVEGKSVSVRVDLGGRSIIKKKK